MAFRGSVNCTPASLICMALESGIDSIMLKNLQYPFQHRKTFEREATVKARHVSEEVSDEIKEYEDTLQGAPLEQKVESLIRLMVVVYFVMSGVGVFVGFLYAVAGEREFYLMQ